MCSSGERTSVACSASRLASLHQRLGDTQVLFDLAESEHDEPTRIEAMRELTPLRTEIDQLEGRTLLNGEYDAREALIPINAQAGGGAAAACAGTMIARSRTGTW